MKPAFQPTLDMRLLRDLIGPVEAALSGAPGPLDTGALARLSRIYLKPAEAMLRRFIWMLAGLLPKRKTGRPEYRLPAIRMKPLRRRAEAPHRKPAFRLTESLAGLPGYTPPGGSQPAIPARKPARPVDPAAAEARLRRRLAALVHALGQPEAEAKRLVARAARGSWLTLDTVRVPGSRSRALPDGMRSILAALNEGALEAARVLAAHYAPPRGQDTS